MYNSLMVLKIRLEFKINVSDTTHTVLTDKKYIWNWRMVIFLDCSFEPDTHFDVKNR